MKNLISVSLIMVIIMMSCEKDKTTKLVFSNPIPEDRENEIIRFTFEELEAIIGPFEQGYLPVFVSEKDTLTTQFINYQGDSQAEEILVSINLEGKEDKTVKVRWISQSEYPVFTNKTGIHFAEIENPNRQIKEALRLQTTKTEESSLVYQMEGPAWENENVGFRNYFDLRNGMDIFGKLTDELVLQNVGLPDRPNGDTEFNFTGSYHEPSDWGMDILKVGNSLGAGSIALEISDSLFRIGDNGKGKFEYLYEGFLCSEFRFRFSDWEADGQSPVITQYISISSGDYCYKSTLFIEDNPENSNFVTGMVNAHSDKAILMDAGNEHIALLTFDKQAEDGKKLGMAILVHSADFISNDNTRNDGAGITETYFLRLKTEEGNALEYRFYSFWESADEKFADPEYIKSVLNREALMIENPVKIIHNNK